MKICILTPRFPMPENGGDVLRINNIARYLKAQGHELLLVSFYDKSVDVEEAGRLYDKIFLVRRNRFASYVYTLLFLICGRPMQCGYYHSRFFKKKLDEVIQTEHPDRFVSHLLRMAPYLERENLYSSSTVEMTDALSKTYSLSSKAKGGLLKKVVYMVERRLIRRYEDHIVKVFPKVVVVSQEDINFINKRVKTGTLVLHTNGVTCLDAFPTVYDQKKICFIGNMRTLQNQDAVLRFVKNIFPIILKRCPDAVFYIVGAEPPREIEALGNGKNIIVTGFVDDLTSMVADTCLAVAPVKIAAGIQNKVLVAMGCGVPVVMTSLISKAIPELRDGENCFIRDDENDFAQACVELLENTQMRNMIAKNGFNMVREHYSWDEKLSGY